MDLDQPKFRLGSQPMLILRKHPNMKMLYFVFLCIFNNNKTLQITYIVFTVSEKHV